MTTLIDIPSINNVLHRVRDIRILKIEKIGSTSQVVPTSIFHVCNYLSRETSSLGSSDESKMTSWSFGAITTPDPLWGCHWIFEVMWRSEFSLTISSLKYSTSTSYRALSVTWLDGTLQALSSISIPRYRGGMHFSFNSLCFGAIILFNGAQSQKSRHIQTLPGMTPDDWILM